MTKTMSHWIGHGSSLGDVVEFYPGKLYKVKRRGVVELYRFLTSDLTGRCAAREYVAWTKPDHDVRYEEFRTTKELESDEIVLVTYKEVVPKSEPLLSPGLFLEVLYEAELYYVFNFHLLNLEPVKVD